MKRLSKKAWITIGAISAPVAAFAIGVPVAISSIDHDKTFEVAIYSDSGPRYFVTEMDTQQNRPKLASADIWDVDQNDKDSIAAASDALGIKDFNLVATLKKNSTYANGLEKLLADLIRVKNNANELTMKFRTATTLPGIQKQKTGTADKTIDFAIPTAIPLTKFTTISAKDRAKKMTDWVDLVKNGKIVASQGYVQEIPAKGVKPAVSGHYDIAKITIDGKLVWDSKNLFASAKGLEKDLTNVGALMFLNTNGVMLVTKEVKDKKEISKVVQTDITRTDAALTKVKKALKV